MGSFYDQLFGVFGSPVVLATFGEPLTHISDGPSGSTEFDGAVRFGEQAAELASHDGRRVKRTADISAVDEDLPAIAVGDVIMIRDEAYVVWGVKGPEGGMLRIDVAQYEDVETSTEGYRGQLA